MFHNFHILTLSSYPFFFFLFMIYFCSSLVLFFKWGISFFFCFFLFFFIFLWVEDASHEGVSGFHNFFVRNGLSLGFFLFVFSEFMLFFSIFWFFFDCSLSPNSEIGEIWSPLGPDLINPFGVPFLNSCILLSSGVSVTWCHYNILSGLCGFGGLVVTLLLSFYFLLLQFEEYSDSFLSICDGVYGGVFFFSTGFHGFHVLMGSIFLLMSLLGLCKNWYNSLFHLGLEFGIIYWHFVDVVWLFLFVFVYWWSF